MQRTFSFQKLSQTLKSISVQLHNLHLSYSSYSTPYHGFDVSIFDLSMFTVEDGATGNNEDGKGY